MESKHTMWRKTEQKNQKRMTEKLWEKIKRDEKAQWECLIKDFKSVATNFVKN